MLRARRHQVDQACRHGAVTKLAGRSIQNAGGRLAENCHSGSVQLHQVLAVKNAGGGLRQRGSHLQASDRPVQMDRPRLK